MKYLSLILTIGLFHSSFVYGQRYGDRVFVENKLLSIYGEKGRDILRRHVFQKPHIFGGSCDPYSQFIESHKGKSFEVSGDSERCVQSFFLEYRRANFLGNSPMRSGAIKNVCQSLSNCSECTAYALGQVGLVGSSKLGPKSIKAIYSLFYPFHGGEQFESLLKSVTNLKPKNELTPKFYLNLFCQTEDWQVL